MPAKRNKSFPQIENICGLSKLYDVYDLSRRDIDPVIEKGLETPDQPVNFGASSKEAILEITGVVGEMVNLGEEYIQLAKVLETAQGRIRCVGRNLDSRVEDLQKKRLITRSDYLILPFDRKSLNEILVDYVHDVERTVPPAPDFKPFPILAGEIALINEIIQYCMSTPNIFNIQTSLERLNQRIDFLNSNFFPQYVADNGVEPSLEAARYVGVALEIFKPFHKAMEAGEEKVRINFKVPQFSTEKKETPPEKEVGFYRNRYKSCQGELDKTRKNAEPGQ